MISPLSAVKAVYYRVPYRGKVAIASARGYWLRRNRYGEPSDRLVAEALARDRLTAAEWESWQADRLAVILGRAATLVPHYRSHWNRAGVDPTEVSDADSLGRWPLLDKDPVRSDPLRFVADDRSRRRLHRVNTSGTSGTPLAVFRRSDDSIRHYAVYEARLRRWNEVSRHEPWVMMGGQLVVPFERQEPPFWVWSAPLNQLYLSTNHINERTVAAYAEQLRITKPTHMFGYPSSITHLARLAVDQDIELPAMRVVISNAEPLLDDQRKALSAAFDCETRNTYGMSEGAAAGAECERGSLHISPENGVIEILGPDGEAVPPGSPGEVVVTGLANETMPLVRYRTGDRAVLSPTGCSCGRGAPVIDRIEGRTSDLIRTRDGREIFWLNPVFADLPIRESQIVQHSVDRLEIRLVADRTWGEEHAEKLRARLRERVGEMTIDIEPVNEIERGPGGKFRPVVSLVERPSEAPRR